jgi:hypothetical protein
MSLGLNRARLSLRTQQGLVSRRRNVWNSSQHKERLVILGSGWGGYGLLRGIDKSRYGEFVNTLALYTHLSRADVMVISPNSYFNFTPLLASSAVGTLEFRCVVEPVSVFPFIWKHVNLTDQGSQVHSTSGEWASLTRNRRPLTIHGVDLLASVVWQHR